MNDLVLRVSRVDGSLLAALQDEQGQLLAAHLFALDVKALLRAQAQASYGTVLSEALFDQAMRDTLAAQLPARVRVALDDSARDLYAVRWERLLRVTGVNVIPLAAHPDTPLSRLLDLDTPPRTPQIGLPLRVVVAISNPVNVKDFDLTPLDVERE